MSYPVFLTERSSDLPAHVRLVARGRGRGSTTMYLTHDEITGEPLYRRDNGWWQVRIRRDGDRLYSVRPEVPSVHDVELVECSHEDWMVGEGILPARLSKAQRKILHKIRTDGHVRQVEVNPAVSYALRRRYLAVLVLLNLCRYQNWCLVLTESGREWARQLGGYVLQQHPVIKIHDGEIVPRKDAWRY